MIFSGKRRARKTGASQEAIMSDYKVPPKPAPDMDAGRSATPKGGPMGGGGQKTAEGTMGNQKTGDGMENEKGNA